jgi:hypothetical protein
MSTSKQIVPSQYGSLFIPMTNERYLNLIYLYLTILPQYEAVLKLNANAIKYPIT